MATAVEAMAEEQEKEKGKSADIIIKDAENVKEWKSRDASRKSMDTLRKKTTPSATEEVPALQVDILDPKSDDQLIKTSPKKKKSKKKMREEAKRLANVLSTDIKFKNVGFETALTKEEKAEKREARKAARDAKLGLKVPAKDKKRAKRKKSGTISEEVIETSAENEKTTDATTVVTKPEESEKKKKKKVGKKGKKESAPPEQEDEEPETVIDMLKRRASRVLEDFAQHRKQSQIIQGKLSLIRRSSEVQKIHRRLSKQIHSADNSLVQLSETRSVLNVGSHIILLDKDGAKRKEREEKKVAGVRKHKKKAIKGTATEKADRQHKATKHKKQKILDQVEFQEVMEAADVHRNIAESEINALHDEPSFQDDRKRVKSKRKVHASKRMLKEESFQEVIEDKVIVDAHQLTRGTKIARASYTSLTSVASRRSEASCMRIRRESGYENEPLVKRDVPPMVPQLLEDVAEVPTNEEDQVVKKKGKKGKKKEVVKEVPMEELTALEQIARMKMQAEAATGATDKEVEKAEPEMKKKKEKKKKKQMTKGARSAHNLERLEQERLAAEAAAAATVEAERIRLNIERRQAAETAKRETLEQNIRNEQLQSSLEHILRYREKKLAHEATVKQEEEWIEYLTCDGLPDPNQCAEMNTYLHLWEQELPIVDMERAEKKTNEVLKLLNAMDLHIDAPYFDDGHKVENWKWVRGLVRDQQVKNLDTVTYRLLRNISQNMQRLDIPTADYRLQSDLFSLCVWLKVQLPIPIPNPRTPAPPRIKLKFPEMGMKVFFPASLNCRQMAIRAMYLKYDHLSDTCDTFDKPPTPDHYTINLQQAAADEFYQKMLYKYTNRTKPKRKEITLEDGTTTWIEPEPEPELLPGQMPPQVPYKQLTPSPEDYVLQMEEDIYKNSRDCLIKTVPLSVLNMREYVILGGVFYLDLYYQPPQPQCMVTYQMTFTTLQRPLSLQQVPFYQKYMPPNPVVAGVRRSPEEIEEELKQQEAELDKLILVNLNMPQHVIWLDIPTVVYWDSHFKVWTKKYIYDFKHIEEKNYLTFRTSVFGTFALATNKYASLPYQAWELKPEIDGTITLQITTALLMLEFNIKGNFVSMTQLQNSPNNALQDIVGNYYKLCTLKKLLIDGGVDVFPEADAFCYIARTCEKHYPTERHLYEHMAQLAGVFNFSWSRWNLLAGRRTVVCQMREYKLGKQRQKAYSMLMVTPLRAVFIDCTEVSPVFNEVPIKDDTIMYADLYHLMKGTFKVAIRIRVNNLPADTINTLAELLIQTRVNSFS